MDDARAVASAGRTIKEPEYPREIGALQELINDRPNSAAVIIERMTGKERAIFAYYLRELGLMIETADANVIAERRAGR